MSLHQLLHVQPRHDGGARSLPFGPRFHDEWRLLAVHTEDKQTPTCQGEM